MMVGSCHVMQHRSHQEDPDSASLLEYLDLTKLSNTILATLPRQYATFRSDAIS